MAHVPKTIGRFEVFAEVFERLPEGGRVLVEEIPIAEVSSFWGPPTG